MKKLQFFLVFLFCLSCSAFAQDITGEVEGYVKDSEGHPLADVNIVISGSSLQGLRGTSSNKGGFFNIQNLNSGSYTVDINSINYQPVTYKNIIIELGRTTSLGIIRLQHKTIKTPEVIVYDKNSIIDPTSTTTGGNISSDTFDKLPTDRNFRSMISLLPQVNKSYFGDQANISGSTGPGNVYYIDGANVTDIQDANTSVNLPYNFVKEVQVKTGGYQAEYGHALGGIINVVTQSGSNEFHGQLFSFYTGNILGGERYPGAVNFKVPGFYSYDVGFSLSGPFIRDKLWFFAAYNPSFDIVNVEVPGLGNYNNKKTTHLFASKLSLQLSSKTYFTISFFGDPFNEDAINIGNLESGWKILNKGVLFATSKNGNYNASFHGWHNIDKNFLIEFSTSYLSHLDQFSPRGNFAPLFWDNVNKTISGGVGSYNKTYETRASLNSNVSILLGNHSLKAGFQYEDNSFRINYEDHPAGKEIRRYADSIYAVYYSISDGGTLNNREASAFAQDSWKLNERFTLNAGFRWDSQYFLNSDGRLVQSITDEYQPRVGLIYQPSGLGTQKIYASYGRFYEQIPMQLSTHYFSKSDAAMQITYDHNPLLNPSGGDTAIINYSNAKILNFKGQYFDEYLLGYEFEFMKYFKINIKGTYRHLLQVVEDGVDPNTGEYVLGNPGTGNMSFFPKLYRKYESIEITLRKLHRRNFDFMISYVLSRNYGNYVGLFDGYRSTINDSFLPDIVDQIPNSTGLLPNDRIHVFKFSGAYAFKFGLTVGSSFVWESGTPLTRYGDISYAYPYFLSQRGTAGRTPSIWDLNFRFNYHLNNLIKTSLDPRIKIDLFHLFSQRTPVGYDQDQYYDRDENGQPVSPNPDYNQPIAFQPPFTARLGLEINF